MERPVKEALVTVERLFRPCRESDAVRRKTRFWVYEIQAPTRAGATNTDSGTRCGYPGGTTAAKLNPMSKITDDLKAEFAAIEKEAAELEAAGDISHIGTRINGRIEALTGAIIALDSRIDRIQAVAE